MQHTSILGLRAPKTARLLSELKEPKRFTDLQRALRMSSRSLTDALRRLEKAGYVQKLPDGRYALTPQGLSLLDELEVLELAREAVRKLGAQPVKEQIAKLLQGSAGEVSEELAIVELLIRVLRSWATATVAWLATPEVSLSSRASDEERRAVALVEGVLRKWGGDDWYTKYSIFVDSGESLNILSLRRKGRSGVCGFAPLSIVPEDKDKLLKRIEESSRWDREQLNRLEQPLRDAVLLLMNLAEARKEALRNRRLGMLERAPDFLDEYLRPASA